MHNPSRPGCGAKEAEPTYDSETPTDTVDDPILRAYGSTANSRKSFWGQPCLRTMIRYNMNQAALLETEASKQERGSSNLSGHALRIRVRA